MQDYIFGDLLKSLRKAKRLSQQALADKLGVHRNTIWSWEQGVYLPDSKGMVLELGRQLGLDEPETRQLLEASLTTVASYWNVPFTRNPFFTGREQVLRQLQAVLSRESSRAALTQSYALHGLGGIGKTQVAVEYAYQHRAEYEAVLWIEAETPTTLVSSFVALADLLALPERLDQKDQSKIVAAVLRWLNRHQGWLLIFDNVEDLAQLKPFLPASGQGALLLTTRLHTLGTLAQTVEISPMTIDEGIPFLLARAMRLSANEAGDSVDPHELAVAQELVVAMGGLPLALDQAGAYIDAARCSLSDYLRLFQSSQLRLLDTHDAASDHPLSVSKTFALAFKRIAQRHPAAAELLTVCAYLSPDAIPESFFLEGAAQLGPTFEMLAADPLAFQDALKALLTYSLFQRDPAAHTLTIHRLVQAVLRGRLSETAQRTWIRRVIEALSQRFPVNEITQADYWQAGERLLSHALTALASSQRWKEDEVFSLALRSHVAAYLRRRAQYAEAEAHFERCVGIGEAALSSEHPLVAEALHGQAEVYLRQGRYTEAEPLYQRALRIWEQQGGPEHPSMTSPLYNLAILYLKQGKYAEAEPLYQRALRVSEQQGGPEHPHVAYPLNGLANLYLEQGKYGEAEPLYQRALHIWEQRLGPEHPLVASPLHNLAILYLKQDKYAEAEPLYQRALRILEQLLGSEHPMVAHPLHGLANLYQARGQYEQAIPLYQRALAIRQQHLIRDHPDFAECLHDFAHLHQLQQHTEEACSLYQQALAIRERVLGPHHPKTEATRNAYAQLLREMGREEEAAIVDTQGMQE